MPPSRYGRQMFFCLSLHCLSLLVRLIASMSVCLFAYLSAYLSVCLRIVCLPAYQPVCLPTYLYVGL